MTLLESFTHAQLAETPNCAHIVLTRDTVVTVLKRLRANLISPAEVQAWASFVKRGYIVGRSTGPVRPVDIEYQRGYETAISESISRLDEIGDVVDGVLREGEIDDFLAALALGE
ncbi:MAG TPA: hypothetical protein VK816_07130 [Jatrophihabitantaceae bacterium]|nr:hypothetical protein [Jatrophihabitantaceae bacterium]